jgi:hypothetical protein
MLITWPIALVASGVIGITGSRHYARDVAAVGGSLDSMAGDTIAAGH